MFDVRGLVARYNENGNGTQENSAHGMKFTEKK